MLAPLCAAAPPPPPPPPPKYCAQGLPASRKQLARLVSFLQGLQEQRDRSRIVSGIITPIHEQWEKANLSPHREFSPATAREVDPLPDSPTTPTYQPTAYLVSAQPTEGSPSFSRRILSVTILLLDPLSGPPNLFNREIVRVLEG